MSRAELEVLIPERGTPALLADTLADLQRSLTELAVPSTVRVLVNGAPQGDYSALQQRYPQVEWQFSRRALGFQGAITRLLEAARSDWVYLLNSDMRLAPQALSAVWAWRSADVFAVASQIVFADAGRRREETGYTVPVVESDGQLHLHDRIAPDDCVRGGLYAGGGAALFQRRSVLEAARFSAAYAPFYFEDADWALQAWSRGRLTLYCPASLAVHQHRATIGSCYSAAHIERTVIRNLQRFRFRYGDLFGAARSRPGLAARCQRWQWRLLGQNLPARRALLNSPLRPSLPWVAAKRFPHAQRSRHGCLRVLMVSPFAVLPPGHGGARRTLELARASAEQIDWVLLHDEAEAVDQPATADDAVFREIHPIGSRPAHGDDVMQRLRAHAHDGMRRELRRLLATQRIDAVCLQHYESLLLIDELPAGLPCLLDLHDVGRELPEAGREALLQRLPRIDRLLLSTAEDRDYWPHPAQLLLCNGVVAAESITPSAIDAPLMMMVPLRYAPNRDGVLAFLAEVWPALRSSYPQARLRLYVGPGGARYLDDYRLPLGVELVDRFVSPNTAYADCALVINPQLQIEGSAVKLLEGLAHGRVVLTTEAGARGFADLSCDALIRRPRLLDLLQPIRELLDRPALRHRLECGGPAAVRGHLWQSRGPVLIEALQHLCRAPSTTTI